jgi:hypothetical protein
MRSPAQIRADEKMRAKRFSHHFVINPTTEPLLFDIAVELKKSGKLNAVLKNAVMNYKDQE